MASQIAFGDTAMSLMKEKLPPHSSHPDFGHLILLVFEAVLEVVCVALPGYIVARRGMFDADAQKFVANLNVQLFTPCLGTSCPALSTSWSDSTLTLDHPQSLPSWPLSSMPTNSRISPSSPSSSSYRHLYHGYAPSPFPRRANYLTDKETL